MMIDDAKDSDDDSLSPKNPANKSDMKLPAPESDSKPFTPPKETANASVTTVESSFKSNMDEFMDRFGIFDSKDALKRFNEMREALQQGGVIPNNKKMQSATEVNDTFDAIYKNFKPSGERA